MCRTEIEAIKVDGEALQQLLGYSSGGALTLKFGTVNMAVKAVLTKLLDVLFAKISANSITAQW